MEAHKPSHVQAIIFDLDDTLIETSRFYHDIRREAFTRLAAIGLDVTGAERLMEEIEAANIKSHGFAADRFPKSLGDLYDLLCLNQEHEPDPVTRLGLEALGWSIYDTAHPIKPGAAELIEKLHADHHQLILLTKGDQEVQWNKIQKLPFKDLFRHIRIVPDKTRETYEQLACELYLSPKHCWVVGDSIRSDINPAVSAGYNAIYLPNVEHAWSYEVEDLDHGYLEVDRLENLMDFFPSRASLLESLQQDSVYLAKGDHLRRLMPDCPCQLKVVTEKHPDGSLHEHFVAFSKGTATVDLGSLGIRELPELRSQVARFTNVWPPTPTHTETTYQEILKTVPQELCSSCSNQLNCISSGIAYGVRID